jgi:hypothetical protein
MHKTAVTFSAQSVLDTVASVALIAGVSAERVPWRVLNSRTSSARSAGSMLETLSPCFGRPSWTRESFVRFL